MELGLWDYAFDELMSLHEVDHSGLLLTTVELLPRLLELLTGVEELFGLNKRLFFSLLIKVEALPLFNDCFSELLCLLFTEDLFIKGLAVLTPALLRKLGELVGNKSFVI